MSLLFKHIHLRIASALVSTVFIVGLSPNLVWGCNVRYRVTDLGTLGSDFSVAFGINNRGQVVGQSDTERGFQHPFLWTPQKGIQDLGYSQDEIYGSADDINNRGQAVGHITDEVTPVIFAFRWSRKEGIVSLIEGGSAVGINDRGQIAGRGAGRGSHPHDFAFLWSPTRGLERLGTLGGLGSRAYAINNIGHVVGDSDISMDASHAFLWTRQRGMRDLGTLGGDYSAALSINERDEIVGDSSTAEGTLSAFLWTRENGMEALGTLGGAYGSARGINSRGQVVGGSGTATSPERHGSIWSRKCGMRDLNELIDPRLGITLGDAYSINDRGQIAGVGSTTDFAHAVLLTPIEINADMEEAAPTAE